MGIVSTTARMLARQVLPELFNQGLSGTKALSYLKSKGIGYRRKTFLGDWREITGAKKLERVYKYIPKKYALNYNLMAPTETNQGKEFKYVFETDNVNSLTGEHSNGTVSMISDRRLSIDDATAEQSDLLSLSEQKYLEDDGYSIAGIELKVVYRKTGT